jgi:hypothetical protein
MQLSDLPQFTIHEIAQPEGSWVLAGSFNHLSGVEEGRSWLYVSLTGSLIGDLISLNRESRLAKFDTYERTRPAVAEVGRSLPWFDATWHDAEHVAVVLDSTHRWREVRFQATDALARSDTGWPELRSAAGAKPEPEEVLMPAGWDHEHCWFCNQHIKPGDVAFTDAEDKWSCFRCYETYVSKQDLGFLHAAT